MAGDCPTRSYLANHLAGFIDEPLDASVSREIHFHYSRNWVKTYAVSIPYLYRVIKERDSAAGAPIFCRLCI